MASAPVNSLPLFYKDLVPLNMSPTGQPGGDGQVDGPKDPADGADPADNEDDPDNG